ncbi:MAG: DUF523 and DUF1722 domain-containing protein [Planctomycetia bacterium]
MDGVRPRLGISACLLGEAVRHDGAHKRDAFLAEVLEPCVLWVPTCPEVELGLGVPREPVGLEAAAGTGGPPRLVALHSRRELGAAMEALATARVAALEAQRIAGCVLKARSPSCGPGGVPVAGREAPAPGAFARVLRLRMPWLPVVDEVALARPAAREAFVAAAFALARWHVAQVEASPQGLARGRAFVDAHRLLLASRDPGAADEAEALLAGPAADPWAARLRLMQALCRVPVPAGQLEAARLAVTQAGPGLTSVERTALLACMDRYERGEAGLGSLLRGLREAVGPALAARWARDPWFVPHPPALGLLEQV